MLPLPRREWAHKIDGTNCATAFEFLYITSSPLNMACPLNKKSAKVYTDEKIKNFMNEKELVAAAKDDQPQWTATVRGTNPSDSSTYKAAVSRWEHLRRFCVFIGDMSSALICDRERCPEVPTPIEPRTIALYMLYMTNEAGTPLSDPTKNNLAVKDAKGGGIKCIGVWNAPQYIEKFCSYVTTLHGFYAHLRDEYVPVCKHCVAANNTSVSDRGSGTFQYLSNTCHVSYTHLDPILCAREILPRLGLC